MHQRDDARCSVGESVYSLSHNRPSLLHHWQSQCQIMWNVFKCIMVVAALMWFSFICVSFKHLLQLMPVHENEIVSNSSSDSSSPNWCIFVVTRFYGNHSSSRRTATLNWFEDVTLPSIVESYSRRQSSLLCATSGVSLSVHFMLSISDSYHDYSFPKHFAHKKTHTS